MLPLSNPEHEVDTGRGPAGAFAARVPLPQAAAVQAGASLVILALTALVPAAGAAHCDAMTWALLQGIVAARLGHGLGMEAWWIPIHTMFVPGLVWTLGFGLPPGYAFAAFCLLASLFWGVSHTRVPLFLSSRAAAQAVVDLLPQEGGFTFLDLGCGLGGVLAYLARARRAVTMASNRRPCRFC